VDYLHALEPWLRKIAREGGTIAAKDDGPLAVMLDLANGVTVRLDSQNVTVQFKFAGEVVEPAGKPAQLVMKGPDLKFSELMEKVLDATTSILDQLGELDPERRLFRFGLVANSRLDGEDLPPGVARFRDHLQRPWARADKVVADLLGVLSESSDVVERCHHYIDINSDREKGRDVVLRLDWQRVWKAGTKLPRGRDKKRVFLDGCAAAAVAYYDRFGLGDLDYGPANG
jgi:hypothetical protein